MIGIVAYWSVHPFIEGHRSGVHRWINLFAYPLRTFDGTHLFMVNRTGAVLDYTSEDFNYQEFEDITELLELYPDAHYVILTAPAPDYLEDFVHPAEDVIYVTGSDFGEVELSKFAGYNHNLVSIKAGTIPLWAHQASTIALYDRSVKQ